MAGGMNVLAPHPWDSLGKPPRPGHPYSIAEYLDGLIEPALSAAIHLRNADQDRAEAERCEDAADNQESLAELILKTLPEALAEALREDPDKFIAAEDVLAAWRRVA